MAYYSYLNILNILNIGVGSKGTVIGYKRVNIWLKLSLMCTQQVFENVNYLI
jgi:hypothetical protein